MKLDGAGDLSMFLNPASVAVVGASDDVTKWGHWLARGALAGREHRRVELVNARSRRVLGHATARTLGELRQPVDLVVLAVPASAVDGVVDEALAGGTRGFLAIGGDLGHGDDLAERVRAGGARLLGPNSLGFYDGARSVHLVAWAQLRPGDLAIVSQSGQLGLELAALGAEVGLGVSRFASVGNQVDVTARDILADLVADDRTRAVVLYAESFGDGRALVEALARLGEAGKPAIVMTTGASDAGRSAARSHTGSLTAPLDVVEAACRAAGAVLVRTPSQAIGTAQLLLRSPPPRGDRVAILGDSGGQGAVAADVATRAGLRVEPFGDGLRSRLEAVLPPQASASNPVDLAGAGEQDIGSYAALISITAAAEEVDAVVLTGYFGRYGEDIASLAEAELEAVGAMGRAVEKWRTPVVLHTMARTSKALGALAAVGVPSYPTIETAIDALASARRLGPPGRRPVRTTAPVRLEPSASPPLGGGYLGARDLLRRAGVAFTPAVAAHDEESIVAAACRLQPPFALKADWLAHKTEVGGVVLHLPNVDEVRSAYRVLAGRLGPGRYVVEEMDTRPDIVEVIVGTRRDETFGPVVTVGAGGVEAELERDVSVELAPVDGGLAAQMVRRLRRSPLFDGWRGSAPLDVDALVEVIVTVSGILLSNPWLAGIELNPVRVGARGAIAVDAALELPGTAAAATPPVSAAGPISSA